MKSPVQYTISFTGNGKRRKCKERWFTWDYLINNTEKALKQKGCAEKYFENCQEVTHVTYLCFYLEKEGINSSNNDKITNVGAPL